jgi:hypothetical protein
VTNPTEQFRLEVARFVEAAKGKLREAVAETLQDLNEEIVTRTPYKQGLLRGSWYLRLDDPGDGPDGKEDKSENGAFTVARLNLDLLATGLPLGSTFYLLNNQRYAKRLEYGFEGEDSLGRSYSQPGRAFVRGTLAEAQTIAEAAAARVATGGGGGKHKGGGGVRADVGWVQE